MALVDQLRRAAAKGAADSPFGAQDHRGKRRTLPASAVDGGLPHCRRNYSVGFG
jgi:hypothetical protein